MVESNKNIVLRLVEEFNRHNLPVVEAMYRDCVCHSIAGELEGEAHRQFLSHLLAAFPDGLWTIDDQIAEGDEVVTRWNFSGTAPTGRKVGITGIVIDRIVDGRIVDEWEETSSSFEIKRLSWAEIECPKCGERFSASKP